MKDLKKQGGITLVALVVTIVVLLILAGVTIMYVLSDNGVFGKAQQASSETNKGVVKEVVMNAVLEAQAEYYDPNSTVVDSTDTITDAATLVNKRIREAGITGTITFTSFCDSTNGTKNTASGDSLTYNGTTYTVVIDSTVTTGQVVTVN